MFERKPDIQIHSLSPLLSKAIKECRLSLDLSKQEFAKKIRKSPNYVEDLEQARVAITSDVLENSANVFGLSVGELVEIAVTEKTLVVACF